MTEVVDWIWEAPTLEERLKRIEEFLTNAVRSGSQLGEAPHSG